MQIEKIDKLRERLMEIYVLFYLCIFPMAMHDKYFDILVFRFRLFWIPTFIFTVIFIVLGLCYSHLQGKLYQAGNKSTVLKTKKKELWKKIKAKYERCRTEEKITSTDIWFTLLFLEMGVSTLLAPYKYEALWGNRGRYQGFLLWTLFYAAYLMVTRFYRYKEWHIDLILLFSLAPCILGIIQFFGPDPFDFFRNTDAKYRYTYASTIGNINTYSAYTAMMMGLSTTIFVLAKKRKLEALSGILMMMHMFAHIMSISDNTVLSTVGLFALLPIIAWKEDRYFLKTIVALNVFIFAMITTGGIYQIGFMTMNQYGNSILIGIGCMKETKITLGILFTFLLILIVLKRAKAQLLPEKTFDTLRKVWKALLIFGVLLVIAVMIYANMPSHLEKIKALPEKYQKILLFNDEWGTGRGLAWRLGFQYYLGDSTLLQKIFGNGLDTYYILMMDRYKHIMRQYEYGVFDNAHNEYIEYLMTIGIVGLVLYVGLMINILKAGLHQKNIVRNAMTVAVFAYICQASVNITVPIVTPIFILFMSISSQKRSLNNWLGL